MGNSSSAGSGSIPAAEILAMISREEADAGTKLLVSDLPVPGEDQLASKLLALGVEMGESSVPGAEMVNCRCCRERLQRFVWVGDVFFLAGRTTGDRGDERAMDRRGPPTDV